MNSKFCHDSEMTSRRSGIESLMMKCPICGREFSCNKTYHVYTALLARKRQYYCSYSCFNKRQTQENNFAGKNVCYYLFSEVLDNGKRASKNWTQNKASAH